MESAGTEGASTAAAVSRSRTTESVRISRQMGALRTTRARTPSIQAASQAKEVRLYRSTYRVESFQRTTGAGEIIQESRTFAYTYMAFVECEKADRWGSAVSFVRAEFVLYYAAVTRREYADLFARRSSAASRVPHRMTKTVVQTGTHTYISVTQPFLITNTHTHADTRHKHPHTDTSTC